MRLTARTVLSIGREILRSWRDRIYETKAYKGIFSVLCALLSRLGHSLRLTFRPEDSNQILILALYRGIGDFALFYHPYQALRVVHRKIKITVVVFPQHVESASLLLQDARIVEFRGWWKLYKKLRKERYWYTVDVAGEKSWKPALFAYLAPSKVRAGVYSNLRGIFYDHPVWYSPDRSIGEILLDVLKPTGVSSVNRVPLRATDLVPIPQSVNHLSDTQNRETLIGLHPGARDDIERFDKRWPAENFGRLAAILVEEIGARVLVLGSAAEQVIGQRVFESSGGKVENLVGQTTLGELLHILGQCDLLVCNNSGLLHLAVLLSVPTVSFMGPINIKQWGPPDDDGKHFVVPNSWGEISGSGLAKQEMETAQLRSIPPEKVVPMVLMQLSSGHSHLQDNMK